jgi:hypothetical protein
LSSSGEVMMGMVVMPLVVPLGPGPATGLVTAVGNHGELGVGSRWCSSRLSWAGLGWARMGWDGLGWAGIGWDGLGWAGMGWDGLGWAGACKLRLATPTRQHPLAFPHCRHPHVHSRYSGVLTS